MRSRDHARENYLRILGVMKGATLANAAFVMTDTDFTNDWYRWPFWVASFVGLIVTYYGTSVGTILTPIHLRLTTTLLGFTLAVAEFVMFSTLAANPSIAGVPQAWFVAFAVWASLASAAIWTVRSSTTSASFDDELDGLINAHRANLRRDGRVSACVAVAAIVVSATYSLWHRDLGAGITAMGCVAIVVMGFALRDQDRDRRLITDDDALQEPRVASVAGGGEAACMPGRPPRPVSTSNIAVGLFALWNVVTRRRTGR